ncbi:FimV family protein [Pseudomonas sp. 21TX0197]|uniref:FimV/HubP family polar landmark protein n=1 Tax=unclassified Pseudomonas TaxID=196821 RepID=UPI0009538F93|nr:MULTISPECIES: FimV/HubP family polar landmark protein [unclassified Pseudomonas]MDB6447024.1 FimV family protein [Pseudomonas sp. 21TX0197]ROO33529.1 peptidoglycan-binding protein [Pseudomonas sp. 7SR1]SIS22447.1 pilus assembly protein FimV [Pseudomonas sp. 7SR1]
MVQVRKLVLAIAAASALSSGMAQALGLGELTLKSTPNQPLVAEIELLDVQQLSAAEVVPSLASPEDFAKAGIDRQAFLNDLTFTPVINANGKSVLRVTSSRPLSEPMVKFLVQVMWPNGRLLRDYSVLLDPSKFSPQAAEAARPKPPQVISTPVTGATKPSQYTTTPRDTLWEIAAKARNGGSIQQTMLAIQALNPNAFIDGNINLLKTGQVLRLPDPVQSTALPQPQAIAEVAAQNAAWRQGRQGRQGVAGTGQQQLDATRRGRGEDAPAQAAGRDKLSLVSAESAKAGAKGKGAAGDAQALSNKLAITQESLDSARRDNEELKSRMADLQSQLDKLQRLIELKNDQLAKMQAEGAAVPPAPGSTPAMSAQLTPPPPSAQAPATVPTPAPQATPQTPPEASPGSTSEATPAATSTEQKYNDLLTNPILLGLIGGGVVLLLLLLLLLARRRKAQQEAEKHLRMARALEEEADFSPELDLPPSSFEGIEVPPPSVKLEPKPVPAPAPKPAPVVAPVVVTPPIAAPLVAPAADRFDDVLPQAQAHIDRGRLNQAADLLEQGIKAEPQRSDLRLKLMEVYGQQGDRDAFVAQERQLVANGDNYAQVEQLKSRFPAMAVAAGAGLAAAAVAAELDAQYVKDLLEDTPPTDEELDSAFDLSLDDLEAAPAATPQPEPIPELDAFPTDDDLSFESVLKQQTEAAESLDDLSEFDLDLGADAPAPALADEDFLLDLDNDLKDLDVPAAETPALDDTPADDLELPADFDLSLADEMNAGEAPKDPFESELDDVNAELERLSDSLGQPSFTAEDALASADEEPDFDFLSGTDEVATKLDLAQAYIDMGDNDGARDILGEVLNEGDATQKSEAQEMLSRLA